MRLLAFDTSGTVISAVAMRDGVFLASRHEQMARGHAERLLPLLQEVLTHASWTWREIELVAVTEGPGNFTGLRAGIAVARAVSLALGCPTLGVGTLALVAEAAAAAAPGNKLPIQIVLDARRDEVYAQRFGPDLVPWTQPELLPLARVAAGLPSPCALAGDAAAGLSALLDGDDCVIEAGRDARYLARAAWRRLAGGAVAAPGTSLRPVYLRPPDARIPAGASILAPRG